MKKYFLLLMMILMISLSGEILEVPADYESIQEAIDESVDGDSVLVAEGVYYECLDLSHKEISLLSWYSIAQDSSYIYNTVIDGGGNDTVVQGLYKCTLAGFTIRNGYASSGGGIYCYNTEGVILEYLIIENNHGGSGGGVECSNSEMIIKNTKVRNNLSHYSGGGMICYNSELVLIGVTIYNNTAHSNGGGVWISDSDVTFSEEFLCSIYDNNISNRFYGSDIYSALEIEVIVDTFTVMQPNNFHAYPLENFSFNILNSSHEQVNSDVYVSPNGDNNNTGLSETDPLRTIGCACSIIEACSLNTLTIHLAEGTYSPQSNGEVFPVTIPDYVTISGESETSVILDAEGVYNILHITEGINAGVMNMILRGGELSFGGGIVCDEECCLFMENVTICDNIARSRGGAIYCNTGSSIIMQNVSVINNSSDCGGGIYGNYADLEIYNSYISINNCVSDYDGMGGGIYMFSGSIIMENTILENNQAMGKGGAIFCTANNIWRDGTSISMENVIFRDNLSMMDGGGLYSEESPYIEMDSVYIEGNYAAGKGGGIYCHATVIEFNGCEVNGNIAANGGGIYLSNTAAFVNRVLIDDNYSSNNGAAIYLYYFSNLLMSNSTVVDNIAGMYGGGIYGYHGAVIYAANSIFWGNLLRQINFGDAAGANLVVLGYCDIEGGENDVVINDNSTLEWLDGNIDENPQFENPALGVYNLSANSPCIDCGIAFLEYNDMDLVDLEEDEYFGNAPDMGAFEFGLVNTDECKIENVKYKISNYPNPFNPETSIVFNLPESEQVKLSVYNLKGQLVQKLTDEILPAGENRISWNGKNDSGRKVSSGIYFYRLIVNGKSLANNKMLLIK